MPNYSLKVDAITTSASANTYKTILGIKLANTTGFKCRLRKLFIGGGGGAAQDLQVDVKLDRTNNATDGTSTAVSNALIGALESESVTSNVAAIGKNYSAEPTTFVGTAFAGGTLNTRGGLLLEWAPGQGPIWIKNTTLAILAAPGAATAATLSAMLEWEE